MDRTPWWRAPSRDQWLSFCAAWSGWVLDAFDFTVFLLAMPAIMEEFGVSQTATALTTTLTLIVRLCGGWLAGSAADRWGRKLPLMVSIVWFALCDGAVALAPTFGCVVALRVLFGLGMGAEWTAGTTLAMESWPERHRGIASGLLQAGWPVGYLLAAWVAGIVIPAYGWRTLFVIAALPALLVIPLRMWVPESPQWADRAGARRGVGVVSLSGAGVWGRILWACGPMGLGFAAYYALVGMYSVLLVRQMGMGHAAMAGLVALFNAGMLVGAVATGVLASRRGIEAAVVVPALLSIPVLPIYVGVWPSLLGVGAFLAGAVGVGWCGIVPAFLTGMFAPEVRARAVGIVYHVGACVGALAMSLPAALADFGGLSLSASIALVAGASELALAAWLLARPQPAQSGPAASPPDPPGALARPVLQGASAAASLLGCAPPPWPAGKAGAIRATRGRLNRLPDRS